jgi:hypothetical protein
VAVLSAGGVVLSAGGAVDASGAAGASLAGGSAAGAGAAASCFAQAANISAATRALRTSLVFIDRYPEKQVVRKRFKQTGLRLDFSDRVTRPGIL